MSFHVSRICTPARLLLAGLGLTSLLHGVAYAQPTGGPPGNHYLVYQVRTPVPGGFPVLLRDQFTSPDFSSHVANPLEWFANPVEKNGEAMLDSLLHYTWWRISTPEPFSQRVVVKNQFGEFELDVQNPQYLLNPANKNTPVPGPPPPHGDHYKCYRAVGPFTPRPVTLRDQFGTFQGQVIAPEWLCNPTEKVYQGVTNPIERPELHYVCYRVQVSPTVPPTTITFLDQFRSGQAMVQNQTWLCVPSYKQIITPAEKTSWGSVKSTYR